MTRFEVELVGGPVAGRRDLRTPRHALPWRIPVLRTRDDERTVAIYRYTRRADDGHHVYTFVEERVRGGTA